MARLWCALIGLGGALTASVAAFVAGMWALIFLGRIHPTLGDIGLFDSWSGCAADSQLAVGHDSQPAAIRGNSEQPQKRVQKTLFGRFLTAANSRTSPTLCCSSPRSRRAGLPGKPSPSTAGSSGATAGSPPDKPCGLEKDCRVVAGLYALTSPGWTDSISHLCSFTLLKCPAIFSRCFPGGL